MELNDWVKVFDSLTPKSRAFGLVINRVLRKFFHGLASLPSMVRDHLASILLEMFPAFTAYRLEWSKQFGITTELSIAQLEAEWGAAGGCSPAYIQSVLQAAGFDAYVHEWFVPGTVPPSARDPIDYVNTSIVLVNDIYYSDKNYLHQCGDGMQCKSDASIRCGDYNGHTTIQKHYSCPDMTNQYPAYFFVGAETFPLQLSLSPGDLRRIEELIYKIKPVNLRCILRVKVVDTIVLARGPNHEIYRSDDRCLSWSIVQDRPISTAELSVLYYAGNGICLAGYTDSAGGRIMRSADYGVTWTTVHTGVEIGVLCFASIRGTDDIIAGTKRSGTSNMRVWRSPDHGQTWAFFSEIASPNENSIAAIVTCASPGVFLLGGGGPYVSSDGVIFKTTDFGATWTLVRTMVRDALYGSGCSHGVDLGDGVYYFGPWRYDKPITRTTDEGDSWTNVYPQDGSLNASAKLALAGHGVAGASSRKLYKTTDYALTWNDIGVTIPYDIGNIVYCNGLCLLGPQFSGGGRLYKSEDDGETWEQLSNGPANNGGVLAAFPI